jgi:AcrR family transcriptional regulator
MSIQSLITGDFVDYSAEFLFIILWRKEIFMIDNENDRRVRKTKKALQEGFSILVMEKDIKDISVRELTDRVDLSRRTFYHHYQDIYELQQQIEEDIIREISLIFTEHKPVKQEQRPYPLLVELLTYIQENTNICCMLLSKNGLVSRLCDCIQDLCLQRWIGHYKPNAYVDELGSFSSFSVVGYIAVIKQWLSSKMDTPLEDLALRMEWMGMCGLGFLTNPNVEFQGKNYTLP